MQGTYGAGMTLCERGHRYARRVTELQYSTAATAAVLSVLVKYDGRLLGVL